MSAASPRPNAHDPYAALGVQPDTPFNEVKAVYRQLVRELHPDVNPDDPTARERFDAVQQAFETLRALNTSTRKGTASVEDPIDSAGGLTGFATGTAPMSFAQTAGTGPMTSTMGTGPAPGSPTAARAAETARAAGTAPTMPRPGTTGSTKDATGPPRGTAGFTQATPTVPRGTAPVPPAAAPRVGRTGGLGSDPAATFTSPDSAALTMLIVPGRTKMLLQPKAQMLYVLLELRPSAAVAAVTQPLNISLVLDHSSSMQRDDKLQRLKEAVARIIDMMNPHDYLSIITFGDRASVLLPSSPLGNKQAAKAALDGIRCRGGTEISTGIRAGLQELQRQPSNLIAQMIVLTDGQTYGDEDICLALATQAGERGIQIAALGLGDDWNSTLLDDLAGRTGSAADYVQSAEHLCAIFEEQLRGLQLTALRNVKMTVHTSISSRVLRATWVAPGIKPLPIPAEPPPAGQPVSLDLGRISTDRDYKLLLELVVAARSPGSTEVGDIELVYDVPSQGREHEGVRYHLETTFVERWESDPPVDLRVHDALRKITAHRLQEQAMQAIQEGQTQKGTASLRMAATHLEAAGCTELAELAKTEAARVERQGQAQAGNMKRIIYGTRKLG